MPVYHLHPQDLLFFRDARPMTAGEGTGGHGARWPEPSLIFDVLHAALHRALPDKTGWHSHKTARNGKPFSPERNQYFGSLQTVGPVPVVPGGAGCPRWLFPCPADVLRADPGKPADCLRPMAQPPGSAWSDLPRPLTHSLASGIEPDKTAPPLWWSREAWQAYLTGNSLPECPEDPLLSQRSLFGNEHLFTAEWTTGIGMNPETQTQDGERIYSAEYLRLRGSVAMGFAASTAEKKNGGISNEDDGDCSGSRRHERLDELFPETGENRIVVGGQQRVCTVEPVKNQRLADLLPLSPPISGYRVKWVLLSPAVFPHIRHKPAEAGRPEVPEHPGGWLPNWIDPESGKVKLILRASKVSRRWDSQRQRTMRDASADLPICARLIAARIPKAVALTGWSDRLHLQDTGLQQSAGPRPLHLAVPAGSVYYFEAGGENEEEQQKNARLLVAALSWHGDPDSPHDGDRVVHRRSSLFGEKGFGLGVCGTWAFDEGGPF